jgi:hypothetical protein
VQAVAKVTKVDSTPGEVWTTLYPSLAPPLAMRGAVSRSINTKYWGTAQCGNPAVNRVAGRSHRWLMLRRPPCPAPPNPRHSANKRVAHTRARLRQQQQRSTTSPWLYPSSPSSTFVRFLFSTPNGTSSLLSAVSAYPVIGLGLQLVGALSVASGALSLASFFFRTFVSPGISVCVFSFFFLPPAHTSCLR